MSGRPIKRTLRGPFGLVLNLVHERRGAAAA